MMKSLRRFPHGPPSSHASPHSSVRRYIAFCLVFLMFFTSAPTHLFSGGFFNSWDGIGAVQEAKAAEHRRERREEGFWPAPDDFYFSEESISELSHLELVEMSVDSNIYHDPETGEETQEFFSLPVRFEDDEGNLIEKDPSLIASDLEGIAYETAAGSAINHFPEIIDSHSPFVLSYENYEISFTLLVDDEVTLGEVEDIEFIDPFGGVGDRPLAAIYEITEDKSFRVQSTDIGIKSEFILETIPETNIFTYVLELTGLRAELSEETTSVLMFCLEGSSEAPIAVIPEGIMWDSSYDGSYSNEIAYVLTRISEGKYYLSLVVCEFYLNSEERVYPVTVDPTFAWQGTAASNIQWFSTNWVRNGTDASSVVGNTNSMPFGRGASTGRVHRSFVQAGANFTNNIRGMSVTSARLELTQRTQTSGLVVQVHRVAGTLPAGGVGVLTWNNAPATASIRNINTAGARSVHNVDVTAWARGVANNTVSNQGFMIRANNETQYGEFYGANNANSGRRPRLVVTRVAPPTAPTAVFIGTQFWRPGQANPTLTWGVINAAAGFNRAEYRIVQGTVSGGAHVASGTAHTGWIHFTPGQTIPIPAAANGCVQVQVRGIDNTGVAGPHGFAWLHIARNAPTFTLGTIRPPTGLQPSGRFYFNDSRRPNLQLTNLFSDMRCSSTQVTKEGQIIRPDGIVGPWRHISTHAGNVHSVENYLPTSFSNDFIVGYSNPHRIQVRVRDQAGHISQLRHWEYFFDASNLEIREVELQGALESGWFNHTELPDLIWSGLSHTFDDRDLPYMTRLLISRNRNPESLRLINPIPLTEFSHDSTGTAPIPVELFADGVPEGINNLYIVAENENGRVSGAINLRYSVDTIAPELRLDVRRPQYSGVIASSNYHYHADAAQVVHGEVYVDTIIKNEQDGVTSGFTGGVLRIEALDGTVHLEVGLDYSLDSQVSIDTRKLEHNLRNGIYRMVFTGQDNAENVAEPAVVYLNIQNLHPAPRVTGIFGEMNPINNTGDFFMSWFFAQGGEQQRSGIEWAVVPSNFDLDDEDGVAALSWTRVEESRNRGSFRVITPLDEQGNPLEGVFRLLTRAIPADLLELPGHIAKTDLKVHLTSPKVVLSGFEAGIVRGSISGPYFVDYQIKLKKTGQPESKFVQVYSGYHEVIDCSLGYVDIALLDVGQSYTLRVLTRDAANNRAYDEINVINLVSADDLNERSGIGLQPFASLGERKPVAVTMNFDRFIADSHQDHFEWFLGGVPTQSLVSGNTPPTFAADFEDLMKFDEGSYHSIFGTNTVRDQWVNSTPDGVGTTAPIIEGVKLAFEDMSDFDTTFGIALGEDGTFSAVSQAAYLQTPRINTSLPFTQFSLSYELSPGADLSIYASIDGSEWQEIAQDRMWALSADSYRSFATCVSLRFVIDASNENCRAAISNITLAPIFVAPDVFTIDFLSGTTPSIFNARDRVDYRTHFYWVSADLKPADLIYDIFYIHDSGSGNTHEADTSLWTQIASSLTSSSFASSNFEYAHEIHYKVRPARIAWLDGEIVRHRAGIPSSSDTSAAADENELTKRLGIQDYWAYESVDTPVGSAQVEKSAGNLVYQNSDRLFDFDPMLQAGITRTYNSQSSLISSFGLGSDFSYNLELIRQQHNWELATDSDTGYNYIFRDETGTLRTFVYNAQQDSYFTYDSMRIRLEKMDEPIKVKAYTQLTSPGIPNVYEMMLVGYVITSYMKKEYWFDQGGKLLHATEKVGQLLAPIPEGHNYRTADHLIPSMTFAYCESTGLLGSMTSRALRTIYFTHNDQRLVSNVWLPDRTVISYSYQDKRLVEVRQHAGHLSPQDFDKRVVPEHDWEFDIVHSYNWRAITLLQRLGIGEGRYLKTGINGIVRYLPNCRSYTPRSWLTYERAQGNEQLVRLVSVENSLGDQLHLTYESSRDLQGRLTAVTYAHRTFIGGPSLNNATRGEVAVTRTTANYFGNPIRVEAGTLRDLWDNRAHTTTKEWWNYLLRSTTRTVEYHVLDDDQIIDIRFGTTVTRTEYDLSLQLPRVTRECSGVTVNRSFQASGINSEEVTAEITCNGQGTIESHFEFCFDDDGFEVHFADISFETTTTRHYVDGFLSLERSYLQRFVDGVTDGNPVPSNQTNFTYDEFGNVTREERIEFGSPQKETVTERTFHFSGRLQKEVTATRVNGVLHERRSVENTYDWHGRLLSSTTTEPCGATSTTSTVYYNDGLVARQTDENGITTYFEYDVGNRVISQRVVTPTRDGRVIPDQVTTTNYGVATADLNVPQGLQTLRGLRTTTVTDPSGLVTRSFVDAQGRTVRVQASGLNTDTTYTICGRPFAVAVNPVTAPSNDAHVTLALFDRAGNQVHSIERPLVEWWIDEDFDWCGVDLPDPDNYYDLTMGVGGNSIWSSKEFDAFGRVIAETDGMRAATHLSYDARGEVSQAILPEAWHVLPNADNWVQESASVNINHEEIIDGGTQTTTTNALGFVSRVTRDASGRTLAVTDYGRPLDAIARTELDHLFPASISTISRYNELGQLDRQTFSNGNFRAYFYDLNGNLTRTEWWVAGATEAANTLQATEVRAYDNRNRLIFITDYRGAVAPQNVIYHQHFEYDIKNRLVSSFEGHQRPDVITASMRTHFRFDRGGRIASVDLPRLSPHGVALFSSPGVQVLGYDYHFDNFGRLSRISARVNQGNGSVALTLRAYAYDRWNRVSEVRDFNLARQDGTSILRRHIFDDFGRVTNINYSFSLLPRQPALGAFETFSYQFDKNSNIISERHVLDLVGTSAHDETRSYTFDSMGRLVFSESNLQGETAYGWDKAGNRRYVHGSEGIEWSDFNGLNQLTTKRAPAGTVTYSYDRNGNKVREQGPGFAREFSYNVCNRLVEVRAGATTGSLATINTNTFRGDGQRISKTELGRTVNYTYQDGAVLYTTGTNNQLINFHLKAPDGALISMLHAQNRGNIASNFTTDIRRSTSTVLCDKGQFFTGFRYSDFGETTRLVDTYEHIEIAYTGGIWDQSTGLYYLNA
ncbi:MAG: DNRLRE domain-containing protein, partial [Coriobacteriia bacterium]|nr:DNRLRE domain-containing protein [Coriobacteriia bacterium]